MHYYFLSVSYHGSNYAGFQIQDNAMTIQGELERVMATYLKQKVDLTGSSRTDAGVHARVNYFHFHSENALDARMVYNLNAMLPKDISVSGLYEVGQSAHSRFDPLSRSYGYYLINKKDPFLQDRAWFYPYPLDLNHLGEMSSVLIGQHDFTSFAKKNSQVHTYMCSIITSEWVENDGLLKYTVEGNRFLRGMVRGLVGTMINFARQKRSVEEFIDVLSVKDNTKADFTAPAHGLFLENIRFPYSLTPSEM